jgi:dTDP-4-dehydrorhamnose reductase
VRAVLKVALIGSNGQLGHEIVRNARSDMFNIIHLTRHHADITTPEGLTVLRQLDFDVMIDTAAVHKVDDIEASPSIAEKAWHVNRGAVDDLASICQDKKAHFIYVSTDYVFGAHVTYDEHNRRQPYHENDFTCPLNIYGQTKAKGEELARVHSLATIVRVSSLFGRHGVSGTGANFVETMIKLAEANKEINVVSDQTMSPTYAGDAAKAILHLAYHRVPGTFHACNTGETSWFGLAARALRYLDRPVRLYPCTTASRPTAARRPAWSVMSNRRLEHVGFKMPYWTTAVDSYMQDRYYKP